MDILAKCRKTAIDAALSAGKFLRARQGKIKTYDFKNGSITNIVTDVDRKSEALIIRTIRKVFPEHEFLAEESGKNKARSEYRWIIDPIDGTTNFVHSFPFFCVSIALEKAGKLEVGVVYNPVHDELFYAQRGKGAYLNRKRIRTSSISDISRSLLATGFAYDADKCTKNDNINNFKEFLRVSQAVRRAGSAALDLCYVACGRFDGFWEWDLSPWDTAAGVVIVKEAGGRVTKFDGSAYTPYDKTLLATNSAIHKNMVSVLRGREDR
ncbi:MAG: inositol monophosphatase family protein [bacterium]